MGYRALHQALQEIEMLHSPQDAVPQGPVLGTSTHMRAKGNGVHLQNVNKGAPTQHFDKALDYKSKLNLHLQQTRQTLAEYNLIEQVGSSHLPEFRSSVFIASRNLRCEGNPQCTRKLSEQSAAYIALSQLQLPRENALDSMD